MVRRRLRHREPWVALWNGGAASSSKATGMLAAIVAPIAAGAVPVRTASNCDGDIVLVLQYRFVHATELLRNAMPPSDGLSSQL